MTTDITPRERVRRAVRHERTDRVPLDMWWTPETGAKLRAHFGVDNDEGIRDSLGLDMVWLWAEYDGVSPAPPEPGIKLSYWGFGRREIEYNGGVYEELCYHPLEGFDSVGQVDDYAWPDTDDFDYAGLAREAAIADRGIERWIGVGESSIFERSWALVGFQEFLEDLFTRPDVAVRIMEHVNDFYIQQTLFTLRACGGRADMVYIADDIGCQQGMLIDPEMWRNLIKPLQKKFNDAILAEFPDVVFHYHSCGSIVPVIDDLIEIGVDILNPIQPKAVGMSARSLAERWGDRLSFLGGLDTQELLPRGTTQQVYEECGRLISILGNGGGYILAPAHAVQVDVPIENVLAIVRAAHETRPS
jgi:uroporphyrinogen decarboxylase